MHPSITALMESLDALVDARAAELDLGAALRRSIRPLGPVAPAALPMLARVPAIAASAPALTAPFCARLVEALPHLAWRQTYSEADGFDRRYLDSYGWCDLVGPDGPYRANGLRVMLGYWGQGLEYPDHSHAPEEHYLVLAGGARFRLGAGPWRRLGPGEVFHTPPGAVHSASMADGPLLALSFWRAADLTVRVDLTGRGRTALAR